MREIHLLEVKIGSITTFGDNYPGRRKVNWPDRILELLRELRKINGDRLKRFNMANAEPAEENSTFRSLFR